MAHMVSEIERLQNKDFRLEADLRIAKDENDCRMVIQNVTEETAVTYKNKILQDRKLLDRLCDKKDQDYARLKVGLFSRREISRTSLLSTRWLVIR